MRIEHQNPEDVPNILASGKSGCDSTADVLTADPERVPQREIVKPQLVYWHPIGLVSEATSALVICTHAVFVTDLAVGNQYQRTQSSETYAILQVIALDEELTFRQTYPFNRASVHRESDE
jgi:hypothetical protein